MTSRRYLFVTTLTLMTLLLVVGSGAYWVSGRFLDRIGEWPRARVVSAQAKSFCLFSSGIKQDEYGYKLALYREFRPEVVAIGSSRVMQFRERYFNRRFLNMGGAVRTPYTLDRLVDDMIELGAPKLVILGVDYWWFNENRYVRAKKNATRPAHWAIEPTFDKVRLPFVWVLENKIELLELASTGYSSGKNLCRLGVIAWKRGDGFGPDGSYYYTSTINGDQPAEDPKFTNTLERIAEGGSRFEWGDKLAPEHLARFLGAVDKLERAGSKVILFIPPLASLPYRAMQQDMAHYSYVWDVPKAVAKAGKTIHDFSDASQLGSRDCEFVDGFHGGEVTYLRILRALEQKEPLLANRLHLPALEQGIEHWHGLAMIPDARVSKAREIDFLDIGCPKQRAGEFN